MGKVKYDGWCIKYDFTDKLFAPVWDTKATLIEWYNRGKLKLWQKHQRQGYVKAVKVRIVEVDE